MLQIMARPGDGKLPDIYTQGNSGPTNPPLAPLELYMYNKETPSRGTDG